MSHLGATLLTESTISTDPLGAFEAIIQKSRDKDSALNDPEKLQRLVSICILALSGQAPLDKDVEKSALAALGSKERIEQKRLIVSCLLRLLLEQNTKWLFDPPWRTVIVTLFDSELAEVYQDRKIDANGMAHQKLEKLVQVVKEAERSFLEALSSLTSLDNLSPRRERLMRSLRNRVAQQFIVPFLPDDYVAQLDEGYKRAEIYLKRRDGSGIIDESNIAIKELERIVQYFEAKGTLYSQWIEEKVGKTLLALIKKDFASNPAIQPAKIIIETPDSKKYPFHHTGQTINLGFIVKNLGPGYSYDTKLVVSADCLKLFTEEVQLGRLAPDASQLIDIHAEVLQTQPSVELYTLIDWRNFDRTEHDAIFTFIIHAQRSDIPWEQLVQSDPYSLEPVTTEHDLVGRKDLLNRLLATLKAKNLGSSIITGQKRVGKTSLAKAIQSHLEGEGYAVVYLEAGDYVEANPAATVVRLGNRIYKEMKNCEPRIVYLKAPEFEGALSPLAEFLDDVIKIIPDRRIVFILDEFDELPLELYARGAIGDSFFLTLRSISSRPNISFVVVGSEKISHVMDCQGDKLNKWNTVPVDYFTRESDWADYKELIQRPVNDALEYTDSALFALHDLTAGNPYFTKLVCQRVFREAVSRRDCHVTVTEVTQAAEIAIREADRNTFQHFWEDGIFERDARGAEKSIRRRKILIALSDVLASQPPALKTKVAEHSLVRDVATVESDLKEFTARKVLVRSIQEETYDFKVPFFSKWLRGRGVKDIIATFSDLDAALRERQKEEEIKIRSEQVQNLVKGWGPYKGQTISEDRVRAWLEQFGGVREQRLMFTLLNKLRFYTDGYIRTKVSEIHSKVTRGTTHRIESGKLRRSDILVSYLDNPAKSGAQLARLYTEEVSIYAANVVEKGKLAEVLKEKKEIQVLLFLDDFVGTGNAASTYLKDLDSMIADVVRERSIKVVFATVVAAIEGWKQVEQIAESLNMPVQVHCCETLDETARCFSETSGIFSEKDQRESAKEIALKYGKLLEKDCPLGYGNLEMAVVFERSCPNNSLPILWSESTTPKWTPLFKRR
jgi:hypothetical protein